MNKTHTMLMRCATIGKGGEARLLAAAKHNLRETGGAHIDSIKSRFNVVMAGPTMALDVIRLAAAKRQAAGIVLGRKDATLAGEIIFGLPSSTSLDTPAYFEACLEWVRTTFGGNVVLSAVVHYDEAAPHAHVLMQPVRDGEWRASGVFGRTPELKLLLDSFFREVASGFGLRRAPERLAAAERRALSQNVLAHLTAINAPVLRCQTWAVVRDLIAADPTPFAEQLGIPIKRRLKTLAELKVSPGRGRKREDTYIDVGALRNRHLCSVGVAQNELGPVTEGQADDATVPVELTAVPSAAAIRSAAEQVRRSVRAETAFDQPLATTGSCLGRTTGSTPVSTKVTLARAVVSSLVSTEEAVLDASAASEAPGQRPSQSRASEMCDLTRAAPAPITGSPGRFAGRLGLSTPRGVQTPTTAACAAPCPESGEGGIVREREMAVDAWDSSKGEFSDAGGASSSARAVRLPHGAAPDHADSSRQREDEIPAEAWDEVLGEHISCVRQGANCCHLVGP